MKRTTYYRDCPQCNGTGKVLLTVGYGMNYTVPPTGTCPRCSGSRQIVDRVVEDDGVITERPYMTADCRPIPKDVLEQDKRDVAAPARSRYTTCDCAQQEGNDWCGPEYCKRADGKCVPRWSRTFIGYMIQKGDDSGGDGDDE
jgi:hypothetical protein